MKRILLFLIKIYRNIGSVLLKNILGVSGFCRFSPTCSEYARLSVQKYGAVKGFVLFIKRLIKCQPFYRIGEEA